MDAVEDKGRERECAGDRFPVFRSARMSLAALMLATGRAASDSMWLEFALSIKYGGGSGSGGMSDDTVDARSDVKEEEEGR